MAHIFPEHLPSSVVQDPGRAAERKVFNSLAQLSEQFTIFYSVAWQVRSPRDGVQDGEADFIIAHPNLGVMIIEVKGGRIHYDANLALWYSRARKDADFSLISTCSEVKRKRVLSVKITNS